MAWVKEFSAISNVSATNTLAVTVPSGGVPAGHFLALGIAHRGTGAATWTVTDSRLNTWTVNLTKAVGATTDGVVLASSVLATTLLPGDTITATSGTGTVDRIAICVEEFNDTITAFDIGSTFDNGGVASTTPNSGNFTTTQSTELLVGALNMVSIGRVYTPDALWTAGTKIATSSGTGDRAIVMQWRSVASTATYNSSGTFNSSALFSAAGAGFKANASSRSGKAKVWDGSAWVSHPAKVWDGSAWVAHNMRGWDGSSWTIGK
jgi:hypothetical protein